uniref:Ajuba LIM protein n=1 Tax=Scleropages formosus TaxID=113540 RepID=A0A8C9WVL2_SCLFO
MDRLGTKLLEKLKRNESVKFPISKKKGDTGNANNNNSSSSSNAAVPAEGTVSLSPGSGSGQPALSSLTPAELLSQGTRAGGHGVISQRVSPVTVPPEGSRSSEHHHAPVAAPVRRRSPQQHSRRYVAETGDIRANDMVLAGSDSYGDPMLLGNGLGPESGIRQTPGQRRYSLELQQLVQRQQLLSQQPPLSPVSYRVPGGALQRYSAAETSFPLEQERHKRFSLQETLSYKRNSTGGELWDRPSSLSHPPSRVSELGGGGVLPGMALSPCSSVSLQESVLTSPRSSFASTASGGSPMGSRCSSNRTSGISLGFDSRYSALQIPLGGRESVTFAGSSHAAGARAGAPFIEMWKDYIDGGAASVTQDSRHSYPPALGTPAADWGEQRAARGGPGDRLRYSDLLGTQYQEELICLLRKEVGLPREAQGDAAGVLELLEGLSLKEQPPSVGNPKPKEEFGVVRDSTDSRQEYFGTCVKCGKGVYGADNACQALESLYHTRCFTCFSCGRTLRNKDFYNVSGSVYCKEDYMFSGFQAAAEKCSVCGHLILEKILQALGNSYHPGCFRCVVCSKALDGVPFTVDYLNNVYCVSDYNKTFAPKCAACLQPILPAEGSEEILRVVSMQKDYHFECYHCEDCGKQLSDQPGAQCFPLDSHLLCHSCHMTRVCAAHSHPPTHNVH